MRDDVVALYVDPRGPYPKLVAEWFDAERDATTYAGPWPIVCHPPCGPWGHLRYLSRHDRADLAPIAVAQVRRWGGVLEHPAHSKLFEACDMPAPGELPDVWGGVTIRVDQCDFGHVARKPTWLYLVGIRSVGPMPPKGTPTHWIGSFALGSKGRVLGARPAHIKACGAQQRRRTPVRFAEWLLNLAASARVEGTDHDHPHP